MFEFIIQLLVDIGEAFLDSWINKIIDRKGTKK